MTIATSPERTRRTSFAVRRTRAWHRFAILTGLIAVDALCFLLADILLRLFGTPPALALFPGNNIGKPGTVIDLIIIIAVIFIGTRYLVGDYSRRQLFWDGARATTKALCICGFVYTTASFLLMPEGALVAFLVSVGLIFLLPSARQGMRYLLGRAGIWLTPTAIFGTNDLAQEVYPVLAKQLALGLDVRWIVPQGEDKLVPSVFSALSPIIAGTQDLVSDLVAAGCRQVVLVPDDQASFDRTGIIDQLVGADINVAIVPSLRHLPLFGLDTSYFFGRDLLLLQVRNNLARLPQRALKRTLDLIGAVCAAILLSPLFLIFALLIKAEDGGPIFFVQHRIGRGGKRFLCWKFRTMVVDAEAQMARWEQENPVLLARYRQSNFKLRLDPRVTRVGAWLRRTSLDELPQLINILWGDMSLVGPRPLLERELPDYGAVISLYERVRPGITGLWQISGRSHTTFAERISYDEWYIKNWTVWYDIAIMLQTVWVMMRREGAY